MTNTPAIARVRYYPLQPLRPAEMTDEQSYHVAMRRRHNLAAHPWGILYGLDLAVDDATGLPVVRSGLAIDGFGRDVVLLRDQAIDVAAFDRFDDETLDVFLQYDRQSATSADTSEESPPLPDRADREVEAPRLVYAVPVPPPADRRSPSQVAPGDLDFGPDRDPPDDPARSWPVFLGQVTRIKAAPPAPAGATYQANPTDRPYAGLVGADVVGPSAEVLLRLGSPSDAGTPRFAVYVAPSQQLQPLGDPSSGAEPAGVAAPIPLDQTPSRLAIDGSGAVSLAGSTTVAGDLTIDGGALVFGDVQPDPPAGTSPPVPDPWTIYRPSPKDPTADAPDPGGEIRVVIDPDGALVVGAFFKAETDPKPSFHPALTIADGAVTIAGNLRVTGAILRSNLDPTPLFSPSAQSSQVGAVLSGIVGSGRDAAAAPDAPVDLLAQLLDETDTATATASIRALLKGRSDRIGKLIQTILGLDEGKTALIAAAVAELPKP